MRSYEILGDEFERFFRLGTSGLFPSPIKIKFNIQSLNCFSLYATEIASNIVDELEMRKFYATILNLEIILEYNSWKPRKREMKNINYSMSMIHIIKCNIFNHYKATLG